MQDYVQFHRTEPSTLLADSPAHLADYAYDSMVAAQVNVCESCGIIQEQPGGTMVEWNPDGDLDCMDCYAAEAFNGRV